MCCRWMRFLFFKKINKNKMIFEVNLHTRRQSTEQQQQVKFKMKKTNVKRELKKGKKIEIKISNSPVAHAEWWRQKLKNHCFLFPHRWELLLGHVSDRRHNCFANAQKSYALKINKMNEKEKKLQFNVSETIQAACISCGRKQSFYKFLHISVKPCVQNFRND